MPDIMVVEPDTKFIAAVISGGGTDVKKCFQCATCSSVCSLSSEQKSFPREQMIKAQWGMRDQLVGDPAVWLCHDCGDCSLRCPRGVKPSRVMGAIRQQVIRHCAFPRFMGDLVSHSMALRLLIAIPAVFLTFLAMLPLRANPSAPLEFATLFPQQRLEDLFFVVSALVIIAYVVAMSRFVRALRAGGVTGPILPSLVPAITEILLHRRFQQCTTERRRSTGHQLVLLSFVGLTIMGTIVGIGTMFGLVTTPLPLLGPLKIFANLCAICGLLGVVLLIANRFKPESRGHPALISTGISS